MPQPETNRERHAALVADLRGLLARTAVTSVSVVYL